MTNLELKMFKELLVKYIASNRQYTVLVTAANRDNIDRLAASAFTEETIVAVDTIIDSRK